MSDVRYTIVESETPHPKYSKIKHRMFNPRTQMLGGWIADPDAVSRNAWITEDSVVLAGASVQDEVVVSGESLIVAGVTLSGNASIKDFLPRHYGAGDSMEVSIGGSAMVSGQILFEGKVVIDGFADVSVAGRYLVIANSSILDDSYVQAMGIIKDSFLIENAYVQGNVSLRDARLSDEMHFMSIDPFGTENITVTLYRTENDNHTLSVGCWTGSVHGLDAEVQRRSECNWSGSEKYKNAMKQQYKVLEALVRARIDLWSVSRW